MPDMGNPLAGYPHPRAEDEMGIEPEPELPCTGAVTSPFAIESCRAQSPQGNGSRFVDVCPVQCGDAAVISPTPPPTGGCCPKLKSLLWYPAGSFLGVFCGIIGYVAFPFGDPFDRHSWWHCLIPCSTMWIGLETCMCCINIHIMVLKAFDEAAKFSFVSFSTAYFVGAAVLTFVWWLIHYAAMETPFYFHGALAAISGTVALNAACPFVCLPTHVRKQPAAWRDSWLAILFNLIFLGNNFMYWGSAAAFLKARPHGFFITATTTILFIISKYIGVFVARKIMSHMSKVEETTYAIGFLMINSNHCSFLIVALGTATVPITIVVMFLDLFSGILIIPFITGHMSVPWYHWPIEAVRKRFWPTTNTEPWSEEHSQEDPKEQALLHLIMAEITEVLFIVAYCVIYILCRAGPNAKWMGGIGANIWHFRTPAITQFSQNLMVAFVAEVITALIKGYALKKYAGTSLLDISARIGKKWGPNICATYAFVLYHQLCITIVHCGMDLEFDSHEVWQPSYNATGWG